MSLSPYNTRLTEAVLRFEKEHQYLERKGRDTKPAKLADVLIGMLNAGGGVLIYGIADDGTPENLEDDLLSSEPQDRLRSYRQVIHDFIAPPANIELEEVYLSGGELVFLYHVEPTYEGVFQRSQGESVFLRVADSTKGPLSRDQVAKLEYNRGVRRFEDEAQPEFLLEDLDVGLCANFLKAMRFQGSFEELAYKRNLCLKRDGSYVFKNSGILLFSSDPERHIPNASVRYVRHEGLERRTGDEFNVIKDQRFEGAIPSLIQELETFLEASLRDYYYLDIEHGKFMRVPEFPKDAWLEGVVNALCHRSYNIQGNPIMIRHFDDRLEIANSGPLPAQVTVENIRNERFARNPRIARTLAELGYVRELNEGVPRIYSAMSDLTLASPEYRDQGGIVTLTLRNKVSAHKETILAEVFEKIETLWPELNASQRKIIETLFEENELTVDGFLKHVPIAEQSIRQNLKKLEQYGILVRISDKIRDRNALYRFAEVLPPISKKESLV